MVTLMNRPIPLDPDLPALSELLPPKGAPEVVARGVSEMTGTRCDPDQARVEYFEYRPRKHCRILWSIPAPTGRGARRRKSAARRLIP